MSWSCPPPRPSWTTWPGLPGPAPNGCWSGPRHPGSSPVSWRSGPPAVRWCWWPTRMRTWNIWPAPKGPRSARNDRRRHPMTEKLSEEQVRQQDLPGWRVVDQSLRTRLRTGDFATGLRLVNLIGQAAEAANHHPDLDLRYPHLDVTLTTHDVGGLSERDVQMARQISDLASREGVVAAPDEAR